MKIELVQASTDSRNYSKSRQKTRRSILGMGKWHCLDKPKLVLSSVAPVTDPVSLTWVHLKTPKSCASPLFLSQRLPTSVMVPLLIFGPEGMVSAYQRGST